MTMTSFEGYVDVPGGRLWAQWAGDGPAVVLVHAGIADSRMWDPQWDALATSHRVIRYDTRGFGRTESEAVPFSNRADLVAVMDAAAVDRVVIVGCSRAGSIALDTTLEHPDRVAGVVWVCGGLSGSEVEDSPEEQAAFDAQEPLAEAKDWAALADSDVALWIDGIGQPSGRAPAAVRNLVRTMCLETYVQEKVDGAPIVLDPPAAGRLSEIDVPLLVIVGLLDPSSTAAAANILEREVAAVRRIDVPDVAHLPSLERPEWFTATLLEFVAEVAVAEGEVAG
jgi:3-oxoadipate enol-lactonase